MWGMRWIIPTLSASHWDQDSIPKSHIYPWNRSYPPYPSGSLGDQNSCHESIGIDSPWETMNFTSFIADDDDGSGISGMRIVSVLMILIVIWTGSAQSAWHLDSDHSKIRLMLVMMAICHWLWSQHWQQTQQCLSLRNQKSHSSFWKS